MTLNRYATALLSFLLIIVAALVAIPAVSFTWMAAVQLGILGVTTGASLGLPLIPSAKWQGVLKTGVPVLLAILNGITPLILGGEYNHVTIGLIVLNALQALASETGIQIRRTAALIDARDSGVVTNLLPGEVTPKEVEAAAVDTPALTNVSSPSPR